MVGVEVHSPLDGGRDRVLGIGLEDRIKIDRLLDDAVDDAPDAGSGSKFALVAEVVAVMDFVFAALLIVRMKRRHAQVLFAIAHLEDNVVEPAGDQMDAL